MYEFATALFAGKDGVSGQDVDVVSISFTWSEAGGGWHAPDIEGGTHLILRVAGTWREYSHPTI